MTSRRFFTAALDSPSFGSVVFVNLLASLHMLAAGCVTTSDPNATAGSAPFLGNPVVLNRRDFIYSVNFSPNSEMLAYTQLVSTDMETTVTDVNPLNPHFQIKINRNEFDLEDVVFVPKPQNNTTNQITYNIAVVSLQGVVRMYDAQSGDLVDEFTDGSPIYRAAVSPNGQYLALGTKDGRIVVLDTNNFALVTENITHDDIVMGLAFLDDQHIASTSFDRSLKISTLLTPPLDNTVDNTVEVAPYTVSLATAKLPNSLVGQVFLTHLNREKATPTIRDARQNYTAITSNGAQRLQLTATGQQKSVTMPLGNMLLPTVHIEKLSIRGIDLPAFDAVICDACVPQGAEIALGQPELDHIVWMDDLQKNRLLAGFAPTYIHEDTQKRLLTTQTVSLLGPATDLSYASKSRSLAVSFSKEKAERSLDIHQDEKRGVFPPKNPNSGAVIYQVSPDTYALTQNNTFVGQHQGFTVTTALDPLGNVLATGGWDRRILLFDAHNGKLRAERAVAMPVRRLRISPDGRWLAVAAWTPAKDGDSEPACLLYPLGG